MTTQTATPARRARTSPRSECSVGPSPSSFDPAPGQYQQQQFHAVGLSLSTESAGVAAIPRGIFLACRRSWRHEPGIYDPRRVGTDAVVLDQRVLADIAHLGSNQPASLHPANRR